MNNVDLKARVSYSNDVICIRCIATAVSKLAATPTVTTVAKGVPKGLPILLHADIKPLLAVAPNFGTALVWGRFH